MALEVLSELESTNGYWQDETSTASVGEARLNRNNSTLKDILARLQRIESSTVSSFGENGNKEILERLIVMESALEDALGRISAIKLPVGTQATEKRFEIITDGIEKIYNRLDIVESRQSAERSAERSSKKGLWKRMFSK